MVRRFQFIYCCQSFKILRPSGAGLLQKSGREAQPAATRIPEAEHHPENVVFVVEKASF